MIDVCVVRSKLSFHYYFILSTNRMNPHLFFKHTISKCNGLKWWKIYNNHFISIQPISIGDDYFGEVQTIQIDRLNRLKTIKIEKMQLIRHRSGIKIIDRNHSTCWNVNHWNSLKLVNLVSVIILETLNWSIYHNCNLFKLTNDTIVQIE